MQSEPMIKHASCVALSASAGLLILGASGAGKSALTLELMAYGATLVSDDRVVLKGDEVAGVIWASAPRAIQGMIEARGVGLLKAQTMDRCIIQAVVDLDKIEEERLPPSRKERLINIELPLYHRVDARHFAPSLIQMLKGGRTA